MPESSNPTVKFKRLPHGEGLPLPAYATDGAAGMDLCAAAKTIIVAGGNMPVFTGFAAEIPAGYVGFLFIRSGAATKRGLVMMNQVGVIDSDYRGEIVVNIMCRTSIGPAARGVRHEVIERGDRIAQLVIAPVSRAHTVEFEELTETVRGEGGFGSTGVK